MTNPITYFKELRNENPVGWAALLVFVLVPAAAVVLSLLGVDGTFLSGAVLVLVGACIIALAWVDTVDNPVYSPVQEFKDWRETRKANRISGQDSNENPVSDFPAGNTALYTHEVENGNGSVVSSDIRFDDGNVIVKESN